MGCPAYLQAFLVYTEISYAIKAKEISVEDKRIFAHDINGKVSEGYKKLTKGVET